MKAQNLRPFEVCNPAFNWRILCQVTDEQRRDAELVRQILSGDERAFDALYKRHKQRIHQYIFNRIGNWHCAEELTDDTFLKVKEHLGTLRAPEKVLNWIFGIASQLIAEWHRNNQRHLQTHSFAEVSGTDMEIAASIAQRMAEDRSLDKQRRRELFEAIAQLPELEQRMLHLQLADKRYEEIADILGVSVGSVRNRLSRAKRDLKAWAEVWEKANAEGLDMDFSAFNEGKDPS